MKNYVAFDAVCKCMQFVGNIDEICKNLDLSRDDVELWRSNKGACYVVIHSREYQDVPKIFTGEWLVVNLVKQIKIVKEEDFKKWYQEI